MAELLADAALTHFLAELNAQSAPGAAETGPRALRAGAEERAATRPKGPEMHTVRNVAIAPDHIPARLHRPVAGPAALVVYLHGVALDLLEEVDDVRRRRELIVTVETQVAVAPVQ